MIKHTYEVPYVVGTKLINSNKQIAFIYKYIIDINGTSVILINFDKTLTQPMSLDSLYANWTKYYVDDKIIIPDLYEYYINQRKVLKHECRRIK